MDLSQPHEARLLLGQNILVRLGSIDMEPWMERFCGVVMTHQELPTQTDLEGKTLYLCGDLDLARKFEAAWNAADRGFVVQERSWGDGGAVDGPRIGLGRVPQSVHGVGVLYPRFFELGPDLFHQVAEAHTFQTLTESTKPGRAHRTGIYLTPVEQVNDELHFRLLRCSTNLSGPTDNFRAVDWTIVGALNEEATSLFENHAPFNHVLAQQYPNVPATDGHKQTKAKIKAHADKTKDMPDNGIMAFCTFYEPIEGLEPLKNDPFDQGVRGTSAWTKLVFRLKPGVADRPGCTLPKHFTVTLYPDSVFFMPLSTNRWYTHEIRPSGLDADRLPTRLGYVVRCSATEAVHKDGQTYLKGRSGLSPLLPPTSDGMVELRQRYAEENRSDRPIDYADRFPFSMNQGDYLPPHYEASDAFRRYAVLDAPGFDELIADVRWLDVGKGRQGNVLVRPDPARGVPIVRTTTKYAIPAEGFRSSHERLAQQIQRMAVLPQAFNNALIERYTPAYTTMGLHSDQALDLDDPSFIALFSCYRDPEGPVRTLIVESKAPSESAFKVPLTHHSVVLFSLEANRRFKHKIVLEPSARTAPNEWLGITFRTSKTFVRFDEGTPYFEDGGLLTLADADERQAFYQMRGRENREPSFAYPRVSYTISPSDQMPPKRP